MVNHSKPTDSEPILVCIWEVVVCDVGLYDEWLVCLVSVSLRGHVYLSMRVCQPFSQAQILWPVVQLCRGDHPSIQLKQTVHWLLPVKINTHYLLAWTWCCGLWYGRTARILCVKLSLFRTNQECWSTKAAGKDHMLPLSENQNLSFFIKCDWAKNNLSNTSVLNLVLMSLQLCFLYFL